MYYFLFALFPNSVTKIITNKNWAIDAKHQIVLPSVGLTPKILIKSIKLIKIKAEIPIPQAPRKQIGMKKKRKWMKKVGVKYSGLVLKGV